MDSAFFLDENGEKIIYEGISSHEGIAEKKIEEEGWQEEYKASGAPNMTYFLIINKGFAAGSDTRRSVYFNRSNVSGDQKRMLGYYIFEEGYKAQELISEEIDKSDEGVSRNDGR